MSVQQYHNFEGRAYRGQVPVDTHAAGGCHQYRLQPDSSCRIPSGLMFRLHDGQGHNTGNLVTQQLVHAPVTHVYMSSLVQ